MPQVSLMIHTASADSFLHAQNIPSYFRALTTCLDRQAFNDFELIYTDTYYEDNADNFAKEIKKHGYPIKHVGVHPEHRYWYDRNHCFIAAAKNTGILYADGELLITCDDAEFFPSEFIGLYWHHYKSGRYMHAVHKRMRSIVTNDGIPVSPLQGDFYINDHRWDRFGDSHNKPFFHRHGSMLYAGTSFSLADGLNLNGFNERMDGCKSLEDCDFGNRLRWLGRSFVIDPNGWMAILDHPNYSEITQTGPDGQQGEVTICIPRKDITNLIAVENYGMLRCAIELTDPVANKHPLTDEHLKIIQRETLKYRQFDPLAAENADNFTVWKNVPTFDLKKQREQLRKSALWRW